MAIPAPDGLTHIVWGQASVDPVTGMAGRIYNYWTTHPFSGLTSPLTPGTPARQAVAALCEAISMGVRDELTTNAVVNSNGQIE